MTVAREAHSYFGASADRSLAEIQAVAQHYPVFRIVTGGREAADAGSRVPAPTAPAHRAAEQQRDTWDRKVRRWRP
jgi:hypothetical protein